VPNKGLFVSLEGPDGAGKSTQRRLLAAALRKLGHKVVETREPGGSPLAEFIRALVLDPKHHGLTHRAELLLFEAARAQHVADTILPALKKGAVVLCDRFTDSTIAYQGYGRGADLKRLADLNRMASGGIAPELTFLLDCPAEVGLSRTARRMESQRPDESREDRFEREEAEFHARVRRGFQEIAQSEPGRVRLLDARRSIEDLHAEICSAVEERLGS